MLITILVLNILIFLLIQTIYRKVERLEIALDSLIDEMNDPNYHGISEDGFPYTISKR